MLIFRAWKVECDITILPVPTSTIAIVLYFRIPTPNLFIPCSVWRVVLIIDALMIGQFYLMLFVVLICYCGHKIVAYGMNIIHNEEENTEEKKKDMIQSFKSNLRMCFTISRSS